ncbi:hypothetical protein K491DRAFT_766477 [Lophiostoma macrostomum CBS 122681]|uniref:DNA polymerase delta subunit 3 n=1 Tax=Lophiostoma macrostomum CBS 122681 TaxID=1314788 RepID=A0A6A6TIL1_9PLEO|nr:hypothetical protein K491DRAFT_766477 [Lophiostoma macrostomum CBS 122681]
MADSYQDFLAAKVLTDSRPVTYRLLSRAVKVNVNIAKQMLYEFYTKQNAKKPRSVHATFLITGRKPDLEHIDGDSNDINGKDGYDSFMISSPFMSSMPEPEESEEPDEPEEAPVLETCISLVPEEELDATKSEYEDITSMHIYSLEPGPIEDLNLLSVCNQDTAKEQAADDPLERWRLYGSIHNPYVKRRTTKATPVPSKTVARPPTKPVAKQAQGAPNVPGKAACARRGSASEDTGSGRSTPQPIPAGGTLKKSDSRSNMKKDKSDIFKSFAKAKPKQKEAAKSKDSTPAPPEDETMQGMSEDEGDGDDTPEVKFDEEKAAEARKARTDREEKLRKMMEEDPDEEMADAPPPDTESQEAAAKSPETDAPVTSQGGRRRGRRKVTKKKTVKDEDGYLVTKQEAVWESFSEDEPEPKKLKPAPKPASSTVKGKKTGKHGQGSIANFFKKT